VSEFGDGGVRDELLRPMNTMALRRLETVAESEWFRVLAQVISSTLLFILVFGMSATVDVKHLREQVKNKGAILAGVVTQYIFMPLLGYLTVISLVGSGMTEPTAIALLIVMSSPGGSYSNWWCSLFNADLALSVTMTTVSTILSILFLPANLLLYITVGFGSRAGGGSILDNIDWGSLFISIAIVIFAIMLGLCASFKVSSHRFNRFMNQLGSCSGVLLIIFSIVVSSLSGSNEAQIWGQTWTFYVGVIAPCLLGLVFATAFALLARLRKPEVVTVGVECCYQNVGIATSAAAAMFKDPIDRGQALCVPLFYGLMEAIVLGIFCIICWKVGWTKAPPNERFCTMIVTTYEVDDDNGRSESTIGPYDEELHENASSLVPPATLSSAESWSENSWRRPPFLFRKRKSSIDEETQNSGSSLPLQRRVSLSRTLNSITEGAVVTIHPMESISSLAPIPDEKGEYARCRINSEDSVGGSAATAATLDSVSK
jgi:predicted Na+-dependent transporter